MLKTPSNLSGNRSYLNIPIARFCKPGIMQGSRGKAEGRDLRHRMMFGAAGYSQDLPQKRMLRDVRMFQTGGGASRAQLNMVARSVFRRRFDPRK